MASKVFADFSGGWYGTLDPAKVPDNMWDGRNIILYRDGSLGPRPGLKPFTLGRTTAGKVTGFHHTLSETKSLLYIDGTHVWSVDDNQSGAQVFDFGAMPGVSFNDYLQPIVNRDSSYSYIGSLEGTGLSTVVRANFATNDLTTSASLTGGVSLSFYGTRLVVGNQLQLFYSQRLQALVGGAANFIDVTNKGGEIVFVSEQRGHLTVVTRDGQFYVLTGVPGVNDTLRRVADVKLKPAWLSFTSMVDVGDDIIYYLSPINNFPGQFDGAEHHDLPYLSMTPEDPRATYASTQTNASYKKSKALQGSDNASPAFVLAAPDNRMLLRHHGTWSLHQFTVDVGQAWASDGRGRMFAFGPVQAGAGTPAWTLDWKLERPTFTTDTHAKVGDNTGTPLDAYFVLPEQWATESEFVRVAQVIVDFTRWDTGAGATNHFDVEVTAIARFSQISDVSQTKEWDQAGASSPATQAGQRDRVRLTFGEQGEGAGYRVALRNIRGVAIRSVQVIYEEINKNDRVY